MACGFAASFIRYQNNRELYAITDASLEFLVLLFQDKRTYHYKVFASNYFSANRNKQGGTIGERLFVLLLG
jgi:hypothetical protein